MIDKHSSHKKITDRKNEYRDPSYCPWWSMPITHITQIKSSDIRLVFRDVLLASATTTNSELTHREESEYRGLYTRSDETPGWSVPMIQ